MEEKVAEKGRGVYCEVKESRGWMEKAVGGKGKRNEKGVG